VVAAQSVLFCAGHCLSFCPFSFGHCNICTSSIYTSGYPLWYFQTFLIYCFTSLNRRVTIVTNPLIRLEWRKTKLWLLGLGLCSLTPRSTTFQLYSRSLVLYVCFVDHCYLFNRCLSPHTLWVRILVWRGVLGRPNKQPRVNSRAMERCAVPVPLVSTVVLLLLQTRW
jgi:hypothetical protein